MPSGLKDMLGSPTTTPLYCVAHACSPAPMAVSTYTQPADDPTAS